MLDPCRIGLPLRFTAGSIIMDAEWIVLSYSWPEDDCRQAGWFFDNCHMYLESNSGVIKKYLLINF
jgi:hypothetical protein